MELLPLKLDQLIVHEIPRQGSGTVTPPRLSQSMSPLDEDSRSFFQTRILSSLQMHGYSAEFDPASTSTVPQIIDHLLTAPRHLIAQSQLLAQHLAEAQTGVPPEGLLVVASGKHGRNPAVVVSKMEKQSGVRVVESSSGPLVLQVTFVPDLMLSQNTSLFKTGLFQLLNGSVEGCVSDHQTAGARGKLIAQFFLTSFLGCKLTNEPRITTKSFFDSALKFVEKSDMADDDKADFVLAVRSELKSTKQRVEPVKFAKEHLAAEEQAPFLAELEKANVPRGSFPKDIELVEKKLAKARYTFETGIMLLGPTDVLEEQVEMKPQASGKVRVKFEDKLKKVR